jgi:phosphate:Na+ symporter
MRCGDHTQGACRRDDRIDLAGAVALLLWASRMVRTGIERAYGGVLKERLRLAVGHRLTAGVTGVGLAVALQSATAVALIVAGFVAGGYMSGAMGIAVMLGADLGSAIVVRILRHDLSLLVPVLLLAGTVAFRASEARKWRQIGRILIGLALLVLSLRLIGEASEPLRESRIMPVIFTYLSRDWITAFLVAGLLAWAFHSSVAALLLIASIADRGLMPEPLVIPLVLGVNFGAAVIAAVLTRTETPQARVVPLGNFIVRGAVMVAALAFQILQPVGLHAFGQNAGDAAVNVHLAVNLVVLLVGLPLVGPIARLLETWLAAPASGTTLSAPPVRLSALKDEDLSTPRSALNNATREVLVVCDKIELMLDWIFEVFETQDAEKMRRIEALDDEIDLIHRDIKFYLARISQAELDTDTARSCQDLLGATIKLEQAADVIAQNMLARVKKKHARNVGFSREGWDELKAMHDEVRANARLAFNLLIDPNIDYARQLVAQKEVVRRMVGDSEARHLQRLREGNPASRETSSIHIDTMRDVKEINSLIVSLAYPVLASAGMLRESRLM